MTIIKSQVGFALPMRNAVAPFRAIRAIDSGLKLSK